MTRAELRRRCEQLPIFPLPGAVLLPGDVMPLHVFELRYRALVQHCADHGQVMGIGTQVEPTADGVDGVGSPPVHPEVGIGWMARVEPLADGRANIALVGLGRCRVVEELPTSHPFRVIRAELREDDLRGMEGAAASLRAMLGRLSMDLPPDDLQLVDTGGRLLLREPAARRAFLAEDRVAWRASMVLERLADLLVDPSGSVGEA